MRLPFINKKVGVGAQGSASGSIQAGTCQNECTSEGELTLAGTASGAFGVIELEATLEGSASQSIKKCLECDTETCLESCTDTICTESSVAGGGSAKVTRTFGLPTTRWQKGSFGVTFGCNAKGSVELGGDVGRTWDTPGVDTETCEACAACDSTHFSGTLGVGAEGGCGVTVKAPFGINRTVGCFSCLTGNASVTGTTTIRSGEGESCTPNGTCYSIEGKAGFGADLTKCWRFRWFNVKVGCTFTAQGEAKADSCANPRFSRDGGLDLECVADLTRPGDCDNTRCCKICDRGKACGDTCIARNRTCRKGRGCACNGRIGRGT